MNLFSACTFRLKRGRSKEGLSNNLVWYRRDSLVMSFTMANTETRSSQSYLTRGGLSPNANFIKSRTGREFSRALYSLYICVLSLIESLKRPGLHVLMQSNCGYASNSAIVRSVHIWCPPITKGCFYLLPRSVHFHFIEAKTRKRTRTMRGRRYPAIVTAAKPRELRLCFLSICARLLELFACIADCINPPQDAFNDTDATRG